MNFTAAADETAPVLIVGGGAAWCDAARERAAQTGLPLDAVRIGHLDGDLFDPRCAWVRQREIQSDGAILVRPDRFIAWRSPTAAGEPLGALAAAFGRIVAPPARARATAGAAS